MKNQIYPCLWFDNQAQTAAKFYCSTFSNSKIIVESSLAVQVEIEGERILNIMANRSQNTRAIDV
jgi:predicted 3-demethylubiquinone-9 3-methyltransferase (glyoxalase superfamily)